jgi:DNA-binding NarL/FixJ family response regulator
MIVFLSRQRRKCLATTVDHLSTVCLTHGIITDMADPNSQGPIRILLADDHAVVRAGIRQFLDGAGDLQVVAEAGSGREACSLVEAQNPDVAVLDIQMPGMSGIEVTRWIRSRQLPVGILVLTAYDEEPYVQAVLKAGANGYVLKTADPQEIIQAVRDVYAGKVVIDNALAHKLLARMSDRDKNTAEELTGRELQILTLTAKGYTNKAIAVQLTISDRTVQNHLANIFDKLQAASRTEAVMRAVSQGLIPPNLTELDESS